jgi:hypothetical protein
LGFPFACCLPCDRSNDWKIVLDPKIPRAVVHMTVHRAASHHSNTQHYP